MKTNATAKAVLRHLAKKVSARGKSVRTVNDILRDAYRLYAHDRATRKAVKHCLR